MSSYRFPMNTAGMYRRTADSVSFEHTLETSEDMMLELLTARGFLKREGKLYVTTTPQAAIGDIEWSVNGVRTLVESAGFFVTDIVAQKGGTGDFCITAVPQITVEMINIFGPPGVGDVMWSLNKINAIRDREAPCRINYTVCGNKFAGDRAFDLLNNCGIIDSCSFEELPLPRGAVCMDLSKPVYNLFANPHVDAGKPLAQWLPDSGLVCDFDLQFTVPDAAIFAAKERMAGKKYVTMYFSSNAWNSECTDGQCWTPKDWAALVIHIAKKGLKPVILGKSWDALYANKVAEELILMGEVPNKIWINMIDRTPFLQAMAFMKGAELTVGCGSSGLTIAAAYMGYNVLTFWPKAGVLPVDPYLCQFIKDGFSTQWMPPDVMAKGLYTALHFGEYNLADAIEHIDRKLPMQQEKAC